MYRKETGEFYFHPGALMCNLFLGDEINRTSPKTQSALLEVMEEGQVSVDGSTYPVPKPFIVIATQNPSGSAGTQLLPESQLDRFCICLRLGYPDMEEEIAILKGRIAQSTIETVRPVLNVTQLLSLQKECQEIFVHDRIYSYIAALCVHRLILNSKARISHVSPLSLLEEILKTTPAPSVRKKTSL